VYVASEP